MRGYSWHRILGSPWLRVQRLFHHGTELWLTWHGPKNCPEVTFYESQSIFIITKHIERKQHHFFFRFLLLGQISGRRHFQDEIGPKTGDHPNSMLQSVCFSLEPCCGRGPSYWTCKKKGLWPVWPTKSVLVIWWCVPNWLSNMVDFPIKSIKPIFGIFHCHQRVDENQYRHKKWEKITLPLKTW